MMYRTLFEQFEQFVNEVADDLTEALGKWVGVDEAFVPDPLRPFTAILSKVWLKQAKIKRSRRCVSSSEIKKIIELS